MLTKLKIDIVSDVSCPWCIIGYKALEQALLNVADKIAAEITWQSFELNPHMLSNFLTFFRHMRI